MGVLDDLRKEAATVKAQEEHARSSEQAQREAVLKKIRPRMQRLYGYLRELSENLNVVDPDVRYDYEVEGFGPLKDLHHQAYRVSTPDNRTVNPVTFHFNCACEGGVKFHVKGKDAAERQRQYMWQHNLRFTSKNLVDGSGVFFLETFVPVTFEFEAQPDREAIRLRVRNLEGLGTNTTYFHPDQLNEEFLEEFGKAILRKHNRFAELSGNALSEEARKRLRQQLAHDSYRRLTERQSRKSAAPPEDGHRRGLFKGLLRRG